MARKRWTPASEDSITPSLLKFREKRKWQINLRRYVIDRSPCPAYAPYFGLDINNLRRWFEFQFSEGISWDNFGKSWQLDHIIPVTYFDHSQEDELKMCWNFTNLRVELFQLNKDRGNRVDILGSKAYFKELLERTGYHICKKILDKIERIEISEIKSSEPQLKFLEENIDFLQLIESYSFFEFELLNAGRSIEEVKKEIEFIKKFEAPPGTN